MVHSRHCSPADSVYVAEHLEELYSRYHIFDLISLGHSICGKNISCVKLGNGTKNLLYIGGHHGMEWMTSLLLLRFIEDLCEFFESGRRLFGIDAEYIIRSRSIFIIPQLNPDGTDIQIHGATADNPMYERLIRANSGSSDFSSWQANGRGVDLNHNYNGGWSEYKLLEPSLGIDGPAPTRFSGEYPESEPETQSICGFIRSAGDFSLVMSLHTQGEEIYCDSRGVTPPRATAMAETLARFSGYRVCRPTGAASYGGLIDWYISEFNRPAFTLECGRGENPLPIERNLEIYAVLRKMLFRSLVL